MIPYSSVYSQVCAPRLWPITHLLHCTECFMLLILWPTYLPLEFYHAILFIIGWKAVFYLLCPDLGFALLWSNQPLWVIASNLLLLSVFVQGVLTRQLSNYAIYMLQCGICEFHVLIHIYMTHHDLERRRVKGGLGIPLFWHTFFEFSPPSVSIYSWTFALAWLQQFTNLCLSHKILSLYPHFCCDFWLLLFLCTTP